MPAVRPCSKGSPLPCKCRSRLTSVSSPFIRAEHLGVNRPLRVVHSALCTRVLLNLHKAASATTGSVLNSYEKQATLVFDHELVIPHIPNTEDIETASESAEDTIAAADWEQCERSDSDTAVGVDV